MFLKRFMEVLEQLDVFLGRLFERFQLQIAELHRLRGYDGDSGGVNFLQFLELRNEVFGQNEHFCVISQLSVRY